MLKILKSPQIRGLFLLLINIYKLNAYKPTESPRLKVLGKPG